MDAETKCKVEEMVLDILKKCIMEEATEFSIRVAASERLGIDLSDNSRKQFVRTIVEGYLLSIAASGNKKSAEAEAEAEAEVKSSGIIPCSEPEPEVLRRIKEDFERVICQLSNRRKVMVQRFRGSKMVSIREFYSKDGKQFPGSKGISLSPGQWLIFKNSVPNIEEAIKKIEGRLRPELTGKENGNVSNSVVDVDPLEPVPVEVIRFGGKNYHCWAQQMELLLKQLKIEYVLTKPCPNATLGEDASAEQIVEAKAAEKRWVNDDLMCRRNILSHLSDHLFNLYATRKMSAMELWEDLRLVYLDEEFGTKRSQVKKYLEFQMVDEKAIVEQIQELNNIANSIIEAGVQIDNNFHVSAIISKLPPSWKDFCIKLMREEHLPISKLMERVQREEEFRNGVKQVAESSNCGIGFHQANKGRLRGPDNRPPGMYRNRSEINARSIPCSVCGKKGHLSRFCWRRNDKQTDERNAEEDTCMRTEDSQGDTRLY